MTSEQNQETAHDQQIAAGSSGEIVVMEGVEATGITENIDDFLQTGRTGRRNAMPHILSQDAEVGTGDLPCEMDKLSCTDSSDAAGASGCSSQGDSTPTNGEAEAQQA